MKKKYLFVVTLIFIISLFLFIFYVKNKNLYVNIIKSNWDLEMSKNYEVIYSLDTPSPFGEGERYHIFKYNNNINKNFEWENDKNEYVENEFTKIISKLNIDREYKPDFKEEYKYYYKIETSSSKSKKIFIIYFYNSNIIYIVEDF
ncbi:hypothetical protein [uncultured Clostridium sp.]|uniref:hypothetical protein n=1 Tax=uncultured Clostridium sp. TaxID=59620 RepID=UPI0025D85C44|nr:hypothetical protein [uncultured Clostridium sp.]